MTHIVEHKSFRYTWELVRHTYLVDSEIGIEIRQVEISPSRENRLLDPPYQLTPFFEIEIDQIQKNGKTVFSLRNICPVQIDQNQDGNLLNSLIKISSPRITRRFQSQDGETETRWLYTDDFFLISLSSGDRHDLSMLLSLLLAKLNMIALSIQSGRRIRSEIENQETYRAAMSTMFSEGVDGAFRDVPVYQQHGEVTSSGSASVAAECAGAAGITTECARQENVSRESISPENVPKESITAERASEEYSPAGSISPESAPVGNTPAERVLAETVNAQTMPAGNVCRSCSAALSSSTTKFCGSCGTPVSTEPPAERAPESSGITAAADSGKTPSTTPEAKLVIDVKSVEELQDLSWLSD